MRKSGFPTWIELTRFGIIPWKKKVSNFSLCKMVLEKDIVWGIICLSLQGRPQDTKVNMRLGMENTLVFCFKFFLEVGRV